MPFRPAVSGPASSAPYGLLSRRHSSTGRERLLYSIYQISPSGLKHLSQLRLFRLGGADLQPAAEGPVDPARDRFGAVAGQFLTGWEVADLYLLMELDHDLDPAEPAEA